jgi:hypothetical protein
MRKSMVDNSRIISATPAKPSWLRRAFSYGLNGWERILFGLIGFACLILCFRALLSNQITAGSALFGMAFFSFFYSNLARFKRFRGLGFEAELWEDKQKEAADLIDRLKGIVSTYTREIVMGNVMRGRLGGSENWEKRWALFDELTGKHTELGQKIDFSPLKHEMDSIFIFDICHPLSGSIRRSIEKATSLVSKNLHKKYGSPISDNEGWNADHAALREVHASLEGELFKRAESENIAQALLNLAEDAQAKLTAAFSVEPEFDPLVLERLSSMSEIISSRPITVSPKLIEWAEWRNDPY